MVNVNAANTWPFLKFHLADTALSILEVNKSVNKYYMSTSLGMQEEVLWSIGFQIKTERKFPSLSVKES